MKDIALVIAVLQYNHLGQEILPLIVCFTSFWTLHDRGRWPSSLLSSWYAWFEIPNHCFTNNTLTWSSDCGIVDTLATGSSAFVEIISELPVKCPYFEYELQSLQTDCRLYHCLCPLILQPSSFCAGQSILPKSFVFVTQKLYCWLGAEVIVKGYNPFQPWDLAATAHF